MGRTVLIEGILLLGIGLVGITEGVSLITHMDPLVVHDIVGPGSYILFLSIALAVMGMIHLAIHLGKDLKMKKVSVSKEMRIRMVGTVLALAIYIFLLKMVGYFLASFIFFLLEFRIVGIKSWPFNAILTSILTVFFYIVFVKYCSMIFPQGIFF